MKLSKKVVSLLLVTSIMSSVSAPAFAADYKSDSSLDSFISINYAPTSYPSSVDGFIMRLYDLALGRGYDNEGIDYWTGKLRNGDMTASNVARYFFTCNEFYGLGYSNDEYVNVLYSVFFNRDADSTGKAYWLNSLNQGNSRRSVLEGFIASQEWADTCLEYGVVAGTNTTSAVKKTPSEEVNTFVKSLYADVLSRDAESSGLTYWANELAYLRKSAKDVAKDFFLSPEFIANSKKLTTNEKLKIFYKVFFNREPDESGLKYWTTQVNNGLSIEGLYNGFVVSDEFASKCNSMGILLNMPDFTPVYGAPDPTEKTTNPNGTAINKSPRNVTIATTNGNVTVNGYYDTEFAYEVFVLLNDYRVSLGLQPLTWSDDMLLGTDVRATEIVYSFSHTRPNGQAFNTVTNGSLFRGENIVGASKANAQEFFDSWKNSEGHNKNMTNPNYKTVSISVFVASSTDPYAKESGMYYYGVQNFGK